MAIIRQQKEWRFRTKAKPTFFGSIFAWGQVPISWKMVNVEGKTQRSAQSSQCTGPLVLAGPEVSNQNHWNQVGPKCVHGLRWDITIDSLSTWNLCFLAESIHGLRCDITTDIQLSFAKSDASFLHIYSELIREETVLLRQKFLNNFPLLMMAPLQPWNILSLHLTRTNKTMCGKPQK